MGIGTSDSKGILLGLERDQLVWLRHLPTSDARPEACSASFGPGVVRTCRLHLWVCFWEFRWPGRLGGGVVRWGWGGDYQREIGRSP